MFILFHVFDDLDANWIEDGLRLQSRGNQSIVVRTLGLWSFGLWSFDQ